MRSIYLAAVAAALLAGSSWAQPAAAPEFSADRVKAHVAFLADDLLEGRDAGTRGYDIAARYVASQYRGARPRARRNGRRLVPERALPPEPLRRGQCPPRPSPAPPSPTARTSSSPRAGPSLARRSTRQWSSSATASQAPELGIDDYKGLDVRGKVVAMLSGFPKGMASDIGAHLASQKAKVAQANGAIGTLNILTPTALKVFSWERRAAYAAVPTLNWLTADGRPYSDSPDLKFGAALNAPAAEALFRGARRPLAAVIAEVGARRRQAQGLRPRPDDALRAGERRHPLRQPQRRRGASRIRSGAQERICAGDGPSRP